MKSKAIIFLLALSLFVPLTSTNAATATNLKGKILIQVESKGTLWYVNPKDSKRYVLIDGASALKTLKSLGVSMSEKNIKTMKTNVVFRKKYIGQVLYQTGSKGDVYYISSDGRYNYLTDGASTLAAAKRLGLGITNANLNKIVEYKMTSKATTQNPSQAKISTSTTTVVKKDNTCSTDDCYKQLAVTKNDSSACYNIKDHKNQGACLVVVYVNLNKNTKNPCDVLKGNYPELDSDCKKLEAELSRPATPRDIAVIGDVKQIQTALELYYNDNGKYPSEVAEGGKIGVIMNSVPYAKKGETVNCSTNYQYKYSFIGNNDYSLSYCIDKLTDISGIKFNLGVNRATPNGIK